MPEVATFSTLRPFPSYFERYSSFSCAQDAMTLWKNIHDVLTNRDTLKQHNLTVQIASFPQSHELYALVYNGPDSVQLRITLFSCSDEDGNQLDEEHPGSNVMVEFHRYYGCHYTFSEFRAVIRSHLLGTEFSQGLRRAPPLGAEFRFPGFDEQKHRRSKMQRTIHLINQEDIKQKIEGLQSACRIATKPSYKPELIVHVDTLKDQIFGTLQSIDSEDARVLAAQLYCSVFRLGILQESRSRLLQIATEFQAQQASTESIYVTLQRKLVFDLISQL